MSDAHRAGDGARLRLARRARGFSQEQLAQMAGVSRQAVSMAEAGLSGPSLRAALALASALGMTVEELFVPKKKLVLPKRDRLSGVFNRADRLLKLWERRGLKEIRAKAIRDAEKWMLDHMRFSEGIGAIYPSMMYAIMAMMLWAMSATIRTLPRRCASLRA